MSPRDRDGKEINVTLRCSVRRDMDCWATECPALDVCSQADGLEAAQAALQEAVDLWLESCLERGTLHQALAELGWDALPEGTRPRFELRYLPVGA